MVANELVISPTHGTKHYMHTIYIKGSDGQLYRHSEWWDADRVLGVAANVNGIVTRSEIVTDMSGIRAIGPDHK